MAHGEVRTIGGKRVASPEYRSWQMMKNRVLNPRAADYMYYGGRGIRLDPAWLDFDRFLADMGRKPAPELTLDRTDTEGDYTPQNCRWVSRKEQSRNRGYVKLSVAKAEEMRAEYRAGRTQMQIAAEYGVTQTTISVVVRDKGWN